MPTLLEMQHERGQLIADARKIIDAADAAGRELTAEEDAKVDELYALSDKREKDIERREKAERLSASLDEPQGRIANQRIIDPTRTTAGTRSDSVSFDYRGQSLEFASGTPIFKLAQPEYKQAFSSFLASGISQMPGNQVGMLQADDNAGGGYTVAPMQFVSELIKAVDNSVFFRQWARVFPLTNAQSMGAPALDTDISDADWTSELATGSEDTSMAFGRRELHPYPLAKRIKLSNKLIRISAIAIESFVLQRLAYKFGVTEEKAFMTGSGAQQPLGVFTASSTGISTGRDVSTDNTTTSMTADGLINALYSLKEQYIARAKWIFHRDGIKQLRKLKDGDGRYIWQPGLQNGQPNLILDKPYAMSEYCPNTFTAGLYVGIVGDFSYYWIAESLQMSIQRLVELYAEQNQVGFIGRRELDGMPVLEEAFARVKLSP